MKTFYILFLFLLGFVSMSGQSLTGIKTIPGTTPTGYPTLTAAITDLNTNGVGTNGVIFEIMAGYTETLTAPLSVTATGTQQDPITFRKNGAGLNPVIYAYPGGTGTPATAVQDGIWNLVGSDFVTIDGIDLADTNATNPATMEYGFGLFKAGTGNGCQYNTIRNCTIQLNRINNVSGSGPAMDGSRAIFVANSLITQQVTNLTPASAAGTNSYNRFYTNVIRNCNIGIGLSGYASSTPYATGDTGNDVGGNTASAGNTILNFGGGGTTSPAAGIRARNQWGVNISNNTLNNNNGSGVNHATTLRGIFAESGANADATISHNLVTITGGGTTGSVYGIDNGIGSGTGSTVITISGNQVTGGYTTATTGVYYAFQNTATASTVLFDNNTVSAITTSGTGALYGFACGSPEFLKVRNNVVLNLTKTGNGILYGIQISTSNVECAGNTIDGITRNSATSTAVLYGIFSSSSSLTERIDSNIVKSFTAPGTSAFYGINVSSGNGNKLIRANQVFNFTGTGTATLYGIYMNNGATDTISGNVVYGFNTTGTTSGSIHGIRIGGGTANAVSGNTVYGLSNNAGTSGAIYGINISGGTTNKVSGNEVYNLSTGSTNPGLYGIYLSSGTTNTVFNNMISDLRTPVANAAIPLAGIYVSGGTRANLYYNTVYLSGTSSAALFGSAALYATTTPLLESRNNILVNLTVPKGSGVCAACRRSGTDLTNYLTASNANAFYAGATEDATHTVFYNGTTAYTLANYQTLVGPSRESVSFRQQPPFTNVTTTPYDLHLQPGIATACESGALRVDLPPMIAEDIDGDIRQGNSGYSGTGTSPDVGADEFNGVPDFNCTTPVPGMTMVTTNTICLGELVTLTLQNQVPGTGITFQWQSAVSQTGPYTDIPGASDPWLTTAPESPAWYRCMVTCQENSESVASDPVQVTFPNLITSVTPGTRCATGTVTLEATVSGGTLQWYPSSSGGTAIGTGSPFTTPVISSFTTYYAAADIPVVPGAVIGAGNSNSTSYENPFYHLYGGKKSQYLIRAAELSTAGLTAGNISSVSLEIVVAASSYNSFNISIGHTALTAMTSTLQTGLTSVFSASVFTPVTGINTFDFPVPFTWDGISNIIIETCWSNNNTGGTSATVKYDAAGFTAQGYYRANSVAPATLCAVTAGTSATTTRPKFYLNYSAPCYGPRVAVAATVTAPPSLTTTENKVVCSGTVTKIAVLSTISDYDTYTWSPVVNLFTDSACTVPYVALQNTPVVYMTNTTGGVFPYLCSATNSVNGCNNTSLTTLVVLPASAVVLAAPTTLCESGSSTLRLIPSSGFESASLQWQSSADGVVYNSIPGATSSAYTTPALTSATHYRLLISTSGGILCQNLSATVDVSHPQVTGTIPGSHCGEGIVQLGATHAGTGEIYWYAAASGGPSIGSGSPFTTPVISTTTAYYAAHRTASSGNATPPGEGTFNSASLSSNPFYSQYANAHNQYLIRASELHGLGFSSGNITSLSFPLISATSSLYNFSIKIGQTSAINLNSFVNESMVEVYSADVQSPMIGDNLFPFTVPFTWDGVSNLLIEICHGNPASATAIFSTAVNVTTYFISTIHTHHNTATSGQEICSDYPATATLISSRPKFTLAFSGCESTRVEVVATVTSPPPVTAVAIPSTICEGDTAQLTVQSSNTEYQYTWIPGYLSGDTVSVSPASTTNYIVYAEDPVYGCSYSDTVQVTVNPSPGPLFIEPSGATVFADSILPLTVYRLMKTAWNPSDFEGITLLWTPWAHLYTDSLATIPYSGQSLSKVYTRSDTTIEYAVTATNDSTGCTASTTTTITVVTGCVPPDMMVATGITWSEATLTWNSTAPPMGYLYELRTLGAVGSGNSGLEVSGFTTDTTFFFSGLMSLTTYSFYVRPVCAEGLNGSWSAPASFTTLAGPLGVEAAVSDVLCYGDTNGMIIAYPYGGYEPYSYLWSTGETTESISGLASGNYSLTVTDSTGDTISSTCFVGMPDSLYISFLIQDINCNGGGSGYIIAYPTGGTSPYDLIWSTGSTGYFLNELSAGTYTLTVTDLNGCQATGSVTLTDPAPLTLEAAITPAGCAGEANGSINLTVQGGTPWYGGYYIQWSNGATTEDISGLFPGNYSVTVSDANGCNTYASYDISMICDTLNVQGVVSGTDCYSATSLIIVAGGGSTLVVEPTGHATFIAGVKIRFLPGTQVQPGGYMLGKIAPLGPFCLASKLTEVPNLPDEVTPVDQDDDFVLYPNPAIGDVTLLSKIQAADNGHIPVRIFNLKGEQVYTTLINTTQTRLETGFLPAGIYFVNILSQERVVTLKLIQTR